MTREEKTEVMFESILSELEKINKRKNSLSEEDPRRNSDDIIPKLESLVQKLGSLKISVHDSDTAEADRFDVVLEKLNSISLRVEDQNMQNKEWHSKSIKSLWWPSHSSGLITAIAVILAITLGIILYSLPNYARYKHSHMKYRFIYFSGNERYLHELDSIWKIDSLRQQRIQYIEKQERLSNEK